MARLAGCICRTKPDLQLNVRLVTTHIAKFKYKHHNILVGNL